MFKLFKKTIAKLVYPDGLRCLLCDKEIPRTDNSLCPNCAPEIISHFCVLCGADLTNAYQRYCDQCLLIKDTLNFDFARAPYAYSDVKVKKIVWQLKYGKKFYVAKHMADDMTKIINETNWNFDFITYVPIHKKRLKQRGYNQSKLLAERIGENLKIKVIPTLIKIKHMQTNATKLGRMERIKALSGSFKRITSVRGKRILLVDDVITSKATANECSRILKEGRAKEIYVITYATSKGIINKLY